MRFGFVTCVRLGLACMEEIYEIGGKLHLVITLPDEAAVHVVAEQPKGTEVRINVLAVRDRRRRGKATLPVMTLMRHHRACRLLP